MNGAADCSNISFTSRKLIGLALETVLEKENAPCSTHIDMGVLLKGNQEGNLHPVTDENIEPPKVKSGSTNHPP